jgi:hypothetical protein
MARWLPTCRIPAGAGLAPAVWAFRTHKSARRYPHPLSWVKWSYEGTSNLLRLPGTLTVGAEQQQGEAATHAGVDADAAVGISVPLSSRVVESPLWRRERPPFVHPSGASFFAFYCRRPAAVRLQKRSPIRTGIHSLHVITR